MPNAKKSALFLSFIIKLWFTRDSPNSVRGRITKVRGSGDDEQRAITNLDQITDFIEESLEQEGASLSYASWIRRRFRWLRRGHLYGKGGES